MHGGSLLGASSGAMSNDKRKALLIAVLLSIITSLVYCGVLGEKFLCYDDNDYVTTNIHVQKGLSWTNVTWAFTSTYASNWHPLTWLSHMLDVQLFGLNPAGHHFMNLLFHILATLLLFGFLRYATGKPWISAFVAALFALHPMHVESVAWVAERKDVLSAAFCFATLWAYAYYTRRPGIARYAMVLMLFALGLLAKPMLVSLPLILLLLDYWPLERLTTNIRVIVRLAAEKLPLLMMAAVSSIITIIAQRAAIASPNKIHLATRLSSAIISYCVYIWQAIWPTNLTAFYPYTHPLPMNVVICSLLLFAITAAVAWKGRRNKYLITGWLWYLVTLIPVIGIVQVGRQAHADRYTYIPYIGLFIMIAWGLDTFANRMQNRKIAPMTTALAIILLAMCCTTWQQVGYWKNDLTLFSHALKVTKDNDVAYNNLGFYYEQLDSTNEAITYYQEALNINPYGDAHYNLGNMLLQSGRMNEAIDHYQKALEINPNKINALSNLAGAYVQTNQPAKAVPLMQRAIALAKAARDESQVNDLTGNLEHLNRAMSAQGIQYQDGGGK
jgi:tetratricopeptide (TPR) repeat protein